MADVKRSSSLESAINISSTLGSLLRLDTDNANKAKRRLFGLILMSLGGFYMTLPNTLIQLIHIHSTVHISALTILFVRSSVTAIMASIFMSVGKINPFPSTKISAGLIILGTTCVGGILFVYLALDKIPVGDVTIILFTSPIFTATLGAIFLHQSCSIMDVLCAVCSFTGLIVMTRPTVIFGKQDEDARELCECITGESDVFDTTDTNQYMQGVSYALVASMLVAVYYVLTQLCGRHADVMLTIFYAGIMGVIMSAGITCLVRKQLTFGHSWEIWLLLFLVGLLSFAHLLLVAEALQFEDAGPCVLVRNADSVYAFILQYTILRVKPGMLTLLGAGIVVLSTTGLGIYRYLSAKKYEDNEKYCK